MLNRTGCVVHFRQPFLDWIKAAGANDGLDLSLAQLNRNTTLYLVEVADRAEFDAWLELNHDILFEDLLVQWTTDASLWPDDRSYQRLLTWCDFDFHAIVVDTGSEPIVDDADAAP